jgi:hypothetical protein
MRRGDRSGLDFLLSHEFAKFTDDLVAGVEHDCISDCGIGIEQFRTHVAVATQLGVQSRWCRRAGCSKSPRSCRWPAARRFFCERRSPGACRFSLDITRATARCYRRMRQHRGRRVVPPIYALWTRRISVRPVHANMLQTLSDRSTFRSEAFRLPPATSSYPRRYSGSRGCNWPFAATALSSGRASAGCCRS